MIVALHGALYCIYLALAIQLIRRLKFFETRGISKNQLSFFFIVKVFAGLALTFVYTYYYTDTSKADIYRYFNDSKIISSVLFTDPVAWLKIISGIGTYSPGAFKHLTGTWYFSHPAGDMVTSNSFLIRVLSICNYFSAYNIFIDTLFFNIITFIGVVALFKSLQPLVEGFERLLFLPLFLTPSIIFWSSGLLKESLLIFGIALYLYGWLQNYKQWSRWNLLLILVAYLVVLMVKMYVAVILAACSLFLPLKFMPFSEKNPLVKRLILGVVLACAFWLALGNQFCAQMIDKRNEFTALALSEQAGSITDKDILNTNCADFFSLLPAALTTAVIRPYVGEAGPIIQNIFAIENLGLAIIMGILLLFFFKRPEGEKLWLFTFFMCFAMLNYLVIGITVPVMGAVVHYRIIASLFLLLAVIMLTDLAKLRKRLRI